VCLALIEEGQVKLGVMGCPNLECKAQKGCLVHAVKDQGAYQASQIIILPKI
jgi:3'(2'), 5'-bisphosphate nucleotidase